MVALSVKSLHNSEFCVTVHAFVLSSLTSFLPSSKTSIINWPDIENLPLADPKYGLPGKIVYMMNMILRVDVHSMIISDGLNQQLAKDEREMYPLAAKITLQDYYVDGLLTGGDTGMELGAALLATKLINEVSQVMKIPKDKLFAWSDSTVVLAWLSGEPSRWTAFGSNRVSEILTILDREQWNHVSTDQNPADCASRGLSVTDLIRYNLWWTGSDFLRKDNHVNTSMNFTTNEEERHIKTLAAVVLLKEEFIWIRFSNLSKLLRVLSYCKKFLMLRVPKKQRVINRIVTAEEMQNIMQICVKKTQELHFSEELQQLKSQEYVVKRSPLHTLNPFLDRNGLLRVGGRTPTLKSPL
ncbi:unnamed protein product [Euphydryas editha]|uniref:Uncharacterized protein n=1 Tax=Euphydryas editha TaxID=104508 RepID=A0AAU9TVA9_EUPED|nr:unnamed protein product [Euphydryas editha]